MAQSNADKKRIAIAGKMRDRREELNWSQEVLAEKVGKMTRLEVLRFEQGHVKNIDTYIRVAAALGLDFDPFKAAIVKTIGYANKYE